MTQEDYTLKIEFTKDELPSKTLNKNPILKIYFDYKFKMGLFYGYLLGSFLMFLFMILINTLK